MSRWRLARYDEIAARLGVQLCLQLDDYDHDRGVAIHEGRLGIQMHWRPRRASVAGHARFLYLIARAQIGEETWDDTEPWRIHYRTLRRAINLQKQAQLRLPRHVWDHQKARLRAMLATVPTDDEERREAMAWAVL